MNAKTTAVFGAVALAALALIFAYPAFAAMSSPAATAANTPAPTAQPSTNLVQLPQALKVGQTVTITSSNGLWRVINSSSSPEVSSGVASGTITLTVTGAYKHGYALSITSGSLSINGSTYAIASGSSEMGPRQARLVGQGTFASATPGSFIMGGAAHADFFGSTFNTLRFDAQANGVEYGVALLVNASQS
ncbi:MAG TPA: hypothetical protein VLY21_02260 [Nitrososphaerales archaeon]|nr:hypothetical protein [Nitrososphaerales archaeon]